MCMHDKHCQIIHELQLNRKTNNSDINRAMIVALTLSNESVFEHDYFHGFFQNGYDAFSSIRGFQCYMKDNNVNEYSVFCSQIVMI